MKKRKLLSLISGTVLSISLLAGCGTGGDTKDEKATGADDKKEQVTYKVGINQFVEHPSLDAALEGFQKAIADAGLKVDYEMKNAQADMSNTQTIAQGLVGNKVDLIFANATPSAQASLNATKEIPIIFTSVTDPVGANLVPSMDQAGENITGTTDTHPDAIPSTVKFIDENTDAKTIGMIYNAGEQNSVAQINIVKKAIEGTDLAVVERSVSTSAEVKQAAESLVGKADVFYIITDNTVVSALEAVISVANEKDIPLFVGELDSVKRGGFAAYGFDYFDIGYEAGQMAVKIFTGEKKASEIPPQFPQKLKLLVNKTAAGEMGLEVKEDWKAEIYEGK